MALKTPDMKDCDKKERCLFGPNEGLAYTPGDECAAGQVFDPGTCDCISQDSRYWQLEWVFAPNLNLNCIGRPDDGYCELGPLEGPYYTNITFPSGLTFVYTGVAGSWYKASSSCGGGFGPGADVGGYCERTDATWVNKGQGWQTCTNATWTTNSVSRMEWFGFEMVTNTRTDTTYTDEVGQTGDLWIYQLGPNASGAVNCNETQYIVGSTCPADSNFDCLTE